MNERTIGDLMREYNAKLERYKRMEVWAATANEEELNKFESAMDQVIADCNEALYAITRHITVTDKQVLDGFDI